MVRVAGKGIRASEVLSRNVSYPKIEVLKIKKPPGLAVVKVLSLSEIGQVLMVGKDLNRVWGTMEIMAPAF